jgi:putative ABC transport system substrate-binding protein
VFTVGSDPVKLGLVAGLNHPGGNITGVNVFSSELVSKRVDMLREMVPNATLIAMLTNSNSPIAGPDAAAAREAAYRLGRQLIVVQAGAESEFEKAFASLPQGVGALLVDGDPFFETSADKLVALAARYALPAIYSEPGFSAAGGLASYGPSIIEAYRQAGVYAGRILRGEKPADLPVVQLSKVDLIVNLKTAKALGLAVPQSVLARADEVIE